MRRFWFITFLMLSALAHAQSPWLQPNHQWQYSLSPGIGPLSPGQITIEGDTIFNNGQTAKKLRQTGFLFDGLGSTDAPPRQFAYADGDRVFFYFYHDSTFHPIYDFSLGIGDTLRFRWAWSSASNPTQLGYWVQDTGSTVIAGQVRRFQLTQMFFNPGPAASWPLYIVEGIGAIGSSLTPNQWPCMYFLLPYWICAGGADGPSIRFQCFSDGTAIFSTAANSMCTLGSSSYAEVPALTLWPNPAQDKIEFEGEILPDVQRLTICNAVGQLLRVLETPANVIDVSALPPGVFFVEFQLNNGRRFVRQAVKI